MDLLVTTLNIGDVVAYSYSYPGPDISISKVLEIKGSKVKVKDLDNQLVCWVDASNLKKCKKVYDLPMDYEQPLKYKWSI